MIPTLLIAVYAALSALLFVMYAADKRAARLGARRIPEKALHLLALLGGWPGALVAQNVLRHKTRKQPFRAIFWVTVAANCAVVGLIVVAPLVLRR